MAKAMPSPNAVATKWAQRMASSGPAMTDGINAVTTSPGQAAAAAKNTWLQAVSQSADRYATNVAAVPLQVWKDATINKGVQRVALGAQAAQPKFEQAMSKWLPTIASIVGSLPPRGGIDANAARSVAFMKAMNAARGR